MVEPALSRVLPAGAAALVSVVLAPPAARFSFRGGDDAAELCDGAFGCGLPRDAGRAAERDGRAALWLGPDEWLLIAPDGEGPSVTAAIEAALGGVPHSLVDVSHRQVGFTVEGRRATDLINAGCPLDLHPAAFPIGACTRTLLAKCDVTLWRRSPSAFRLEVNRSFADYLAGILRAAERDL